MSEAPVKEETEQETKETIAVPTIGIETLNAVMKGLFARIGKPSKYTDLETQIQPKIAGNVISSGLKVAKTLGLAEVERGSGRGAYVLTPPGKQYARDLQASNETGIAAILRRQILTLPQWKEVVVFLRSNKSQPVKTTLLSQHMANQGDKNWQTGALELYGANYASILKAAGLVTWAGGQITPLPIEEVAETSLETGRDTGAGKQEDQGSNQGAIPPQGANIPAPQQPQQQHQFALQMPITINITIDAKDPQAISNLIALIRAARGDEPSSGKADVSASGSDSSESAKN